MDMIRIVSFALIAMIMILFIRNNRPEFALLIEIIAGIMIFLMMVSHLSDIFKEVGEITKRIGFDKTYFVILMKIVGITYIAEFGIALCKDANQTALATKVEIAAKVLILAISIPIVDILLDKIALIIK